MIAADRFERGSAGMGWNTSLAGWGLSPVPLGLWERTAGAAALTWGAGPTRGLWDLWRRSDEISALERDDPRMQEMLDPTEAAYEFPLLELPVRSRMTRGELTYIQKRDVERRRVERALSGSNTSAVPDIVADLTGGIAGAVADPVNIGLGLLTFAGLGHVPAARSLATMAVLGRTVAARRGAAAALMAADGFAGGLLYTAANWPIQNLNNRPYGWGRMVEDVLASSAFGGVLGGAFPKLADLHSVASLRWGDSKVFIPNLLRVRSMVADPDGLRRFWKYMDDEAGFIRLPDVGKVLAGRNVPMREPVARALGKAVEKTVPGSILSGPASSATQVMAHRVGPSKRFRGVRMGTGGVRSILGVGFEKPRPFYRSTARGRAAKPIAPRGRSKPWEVQYDVAYVAMEPMKRSGRYRNPLTLALSPDEAAAMYLADSTGRIAASRIGVLEVALATGGGKRGLRLVDLDHREIGTDLGLVERGALPRFLRRIKRKGGGWQSWMQPMTLFSDYNGRQQGRIMDAVLSNPNYDGLVVSAWQGGPRRVLLRRDSMEKVQAVADTYHDYPFRKDRRVTPEDVEKFTAALRGQDPDSAPPSVRWLLDEYIRSFDEKVGGKTFFDRFLRRVHPEEINYRSPGRGWDTIRFEDVKFDGRTDFFRLPTKVWGAIHEVLKEKGLTANLNRVTVRDLDSLIDDVLMVQGDDTAVAPFFESLRGKGFAFPDMIDPRHPAGRWFLLDDRVLPPLGEDQTVFSAIFDGSRPDFDTVKIGLQPTTLRLDLHPLGMVPDEIAAARRLVKEGVPMDVDVHTNRTFWGDRKQAGSILRGPVRSPLLGLGFSDAVLESGRAPVRLAGDDGRVPAFVTGADARRMYKEIEVPLPKETEAEGGKPKAPERDERQEATLKGLEAMAGAGPEIAVRRLGLAVEGALGGSAARARIRGLVTEHTELHRRLRETDPSDPLHNEMLVRQRNLAEDVRKIHRAIVAVGAGGYDPRMIAEDPRKWMKLLAKSRGVAEGTFGDWGQGDELLNFFKYMPDAPYATMGGDNVIATQSNIERTLKTLLFRRLENDPEHGRDLLDMLAKGMLDKQLHQIEHYAVRKLREQGATLQKIAEEGAEDLKTVSPAAWKAYEAIREVMDASQKTLLDSGYYRAPRRGYMGVVAYDTGRVLARGRDGFVKDLLEAAEFRGGDGNPLTPDAAAAAAEDVFDSFQDQSRFTFNVDGPVAEMRTLLDRHRRVDFRTADTKIAFLDKYGRVPGPNSSRVSSWNKWNLGTGSNVLSGVFSSIDNDARLAGVTAWFGNRPFLAIDLATNALGVKWAKKFDEMGMGEIPKRRVVAGLNNAKEHAEAVLQAMIFGENESFGIAAQARKTLMSLMNLKLLSLASIPAFFGDMGASLAHFSRMSGGKVMGPISNMTRERLKHLRPSVRREVARRTNVLLTADTRDYTRRFYGSEGAGLWSWLETSLMRTTGLPLVTDMARSSNGLLMAHVLADHFRTPLSGLPRQAAHLYRTHGIDDAAWESLRSLPDVRLDVDGMEFVWMDKIDEALRRGVRTGKFSRPQAARLYNSLSTLVDSVANERSVPQQGFYENSFFTTNRNPDSIMYNLLKMYSQYKGIAVTVGRTMMDAGFGKTVGVHGDVFHASMAKVMAIGTAFGGMTILTRDVASGKQPRDVFDTQFFLEAMMRGGMFGLAGDFIFGEHNSYVGGYSGNFVGPSIMGPGYHGVRFLRNLMLLEGEEAGDAALDLVESLTPNLTPAHPILLNTFLLHSWGALGGDAASRGRIRNRLEEMGSGYLAD